MPSNLVRFNEKLYEKKYQAAGSEFTYIPYLDNVKPKKKRCIAQELQIGYMKMLSYYDLNK
ncbi:hypothetical protein [Cytobacillus praedii]|uniref:hypothetical protein n=1 Tax=Cytobacillus praedii TaxID=1742358 RepID=UPI002E1A9E62|nr:hypothetical protein [Cytobacillus praedii]